MQRIIYDIWTGKVIVEYNYMPVWKSDVPAPKDIVTNFFDMQKSLLSLWGIK